MEKKVDYWDKVVFILRNIFFGFLVYSYFSVIFTIFRKGTSGIVIGLTALSMFFAFKNDINPIKLNHQEFGKYTDVIGIALVLFFTLLFGSTFRN